MRESEELREVDSRYLNTKSRIGKEVGGMGGALLSRSAQTAHVGGKGTWPPQSTPIIFQKRSSTAQTLLKKYFVFRIKLGANALLNHY